MVIKWVAPYRNEWILRNCDSNNFSLVTFVDDLAFIGVESCLRRLQARLLREVLVLVPHFRLLNFVCFRGFQVRFEKGINAGPSPMRSDKI